MTERGDSTNKTADKVGPMLELSMEITETTEENKEKDKEAVKGLKAMKRGKRNNEFPFLKHLTLPVSVQFGKLKAKYVLLPKAFICVAYWKIMEEKKAQQEKEG